MASKNFWLIGSAVSLFFLLLILALFKGSECQLISWRLLKEKNNPILELKIVSCLLDNQEFSLAGEKLKEIKGKAGVKDSPFLAEQVKMYEQRLRSTDPVLRAKEITFWKKKAVTNPSYPDAWLSLGLLWYQQGDEFRARLAMTKACQLDPIREDIKKLADQLGLKN